MIRIILNKYLEYRVKQACRIKWQKIIAGNKQAALSSTAYKAYLDLWRPLVNSPASYYLDSYCSISGVDDFTYTPEDIYYTTIEPTLNDKSFALAYSDKNFYQKYLADLSELFPAVIVRKINSIYFNEKYELISGNESLLKYFETDKTYILKSAVETSGGEDVFAVQLNQEQSGITVLGKQGQHNTFEGLLKKYQHFIIQEKIVQHPWFAAFNNSSVNTVRMYTYRSVIDNQTHVLSAVLRFGMQGQFVDNQAAGGLTIGISKLGVLNNFVCNKFGRVALSNAPYESNFNQSVPLFNEMNRIAAMIAPRYHYQRLLGFDFCVSDKGEVKLLEINCKNIEINFLQMNNGPLFGSYTKEIIDYCCKHPKKVLLDFTI